MKKSPTSIQAVNTYEVPPVKTLPGTTENKVNMDSNMINAIASVPEDKMARYRKFQNNLLIGSRVIIVFAIWSVIRFIILVCFDTDGYEAMLQYYELDLSMKNLATACYFIIYSLDVFFRCFTGIVVARAGKKQKRSIICIAMLAFLIMISIFNVSSYIIGKSRETTDFDTIISAGVEITVLYNLCEVLVSYIGMLNISKKYRLGD